MLRILTASAVVAVGATALMAQNLDIIKARKELLKGMGSAAKAPGAMMKGEAPIDIAKVKAALKSFQDGAPKLPAMFPDNSKTGGETEALPVIWEKKKEFEEGFSKLAAAAKAAEATIDEMNFATEWPKVVGNCSACHKVFRQAK